MNSKNQQKDNDKYVPLKEGYQPSKDTFKPGYNPEKKRKPTPPPVKP